MALVYLPMHDKIVNTETINYVDLIGRTDRYHEEHVIVKFDGGNFLEFPPGVTLYEIYTTLIEGSSNG